MTAAQTFLALVVVACWVLTIFKTRDFIRDRTTVALRYLWVAMVTITISLTLQPLAAPLDQLIGRLDFTRVTSNCLTLMAATCGQGFLLYMTAEDATNRRRMRNRLAALAGVLLLIIVSFLITPPRYAINDPAVLHGDPYSATPTLATAPYVGLYLAFLGWALTENSIMAARYARKVGQPPVTRFGLWLVCVGSALGPLYAAFKVGAMVAVSAHHPQPVALDALVVFIYSLATLLILIGSTIPKWGPMIGLDAVWEWARAIRAVRRITPLWRTLQEVTPGIVLESVPTRGLAGWWKVARRPTWYRARANGEVLDAFARLNDWKSQDVADAAVQACARNKLADDDRAVIVEATVLAAAVRARRENLPPATPGWEPPNQPATAGDQVHHLSRVAYAIQHSPIVREILQASDPGSPTVNTGQTA